MYSDTLDHSIEDKQDNIFSETTDGSPSSENSNLEITDGSGSSSGSESQIDVIITRGESGASESRIDIVATDENGENNDSDTHSNGAKSTSTSTRGSSSSSSSEASPNDYFRVEDSFKITTSFAYSLASKSGKDDVSISESPAKSEVDNSPRVPTSTFQFYDTYSKKGISQTTSPPIQVMDRSGRYDPARIPSSVFERNTNNPLEWSIASNESLFSIQLGQNSFSRDAFLLFGEPVISEEITKSDELNMLNRVPSLAIEEIDTARKNADAENHQTIEQLHESFKLEEMPSEDQNEAPSSIHQPVSSLHQTASSKSSKSRTSSLCHGDGASTHSLPLPFEVAGSQYFNAAMHHGSIWKQSLCINIGKKRSRSFCYCFDCSFCDYKFPTCCYAWWPSCKCSFGGWSFSCCWNFNYLRCCACGRASTVSTEETDRINSLKTDIPPQQLYKQESEVISNSSTSYCSCLKSCFNCWSWFHCFSCPSCPSCTWKISFTKCKCCF